MKIFKAKSNRKKTVSSPPLPEPPHPFPKKEKTTETTCGVKLYSTPSYLVSYIEVIYALSLTEQKICKYNIDDTIKSFLHLLSVKYNGSYRPLLACQKIIDFMSICFSKNASWLTCIKKIELLRSLNRYLPLAEIKLFCYG